MDCTRCLLRSLIDSNKNGRSASNFLKVSAGRRVLTRYCRCETTEGGSNTTSRSTDRCGESFRSVGVKKSGVNYIKRKSISATDPELRAAGRWADGRKHAREVLEVGEEGGTYEIEPSIRTDSFR